MFTDMKVTKLITTTILATFLYSFVVHEPLYGVVQLQSENAAGSALLQKLSAPILPIEYARVVGGGYGVNRSGNSVVGVKGKEVVAQRGIKAEKLLIHIQDLHCHPQVQKNIYKLLEYIDTKYGINKIMVEGAPSGKVDTSILSSIPDEKIKQQTLDGLMEKGLISGAEYYTAVKKQDKLYGIEEWTKYQENLSRAQNLIEKQTQNEQVCTTLLKTIKGLNDWYISEPVRALQKSLQQETENPVKNEEYYLKLSKLAQQSGENLFDYPNLARQIEQIEISHQTNFNKITGELQSYQKELQGTLPYEVYAGLIDKLKTVGKDNSNLQEYYYLLGETARTYSPDLYIQKPNLSKFFQQTRLMRATNPMYLNAEEKAFTRNILARQAQTKLEKELIQIETMTKLLKELISLKITADDYAYYKENITQYLSLLDQYLDNKDTHYAKELINDPETLAYYQTNIDRNAIFTKSIENSVLLSEKSLSTQKSLSFPNANIGNLSSKTTSQSNKKEVPVIPEDKKLSSPNVVIGDLTYSNNYSEVLNNISNFKEIDIIVTGGFHNDIGSMLQQNGYAYLMLTPTFNENYSQDIYEKVLLSSNLFTEFAKAAFAPALISQIINNGNSQNQALTSLGILTEYIKDALSSKNKLADIVVKINSWAQNNKLKITETSKDSISIEASGGVWKLSFADRKFSVTAENNIAKEIESISQNKIASFHHNDNSYLEKLLESPMVIIHAMLALAQVLQLQEGSLKIVNNNGVPIGYKPFDQVHKQGDWHPKARVVLCTRKGEIITLTHPGTNRLDLPGGNVDPGETDEVAALREIGEELNIKLSSDRLNRIRNPKNPTGLFKQSGSNKNSSNYYDAKDDTFHYISTAEHNNELFGLFVVTLTEEEEVLIQQKFQKNSEADSIKIVNPAEITPNLTGNDYDSFISHLFSQDEIKNSILAQIKPQQQPSIDSVAKAVRTLTPSTKDRITNELKRLNVPADEIARILEETRKAIESGKYYINEENPAKVAVLGYKKSNSPIIGNKIDASEELEPKGEIDYIVGLLCGFWVQASRVLCMSPNGEEIVIVRRAHEPYKNTYTFPSGVSGMETPEENALLEIRQELGLKKAPENKVKLLKKEILTLDNSVAQQVIHTYTYTLTQVEFDEVKALQRTINETRDQKGADFDGYLFKLRKDKKTEKGMEGEVSDIQIVNYAKFVSGQIALPYTPDTIVRFINANAKKSAVSMSILQPLTEKFKGENKGKLSLTEKILTELSNPIYGSPNWETFAFLTVPFALLQASFGQILSTTPFAIGASLGIVAFSALHIVVRWMVEKNKPKEQRTYQTTAQASLAFLRYIIPGALFTVPYIAIVIFSPFSLVINHLIAYAVTTLIHAGFNITVKLNLFKLITKIGFASVVAALCEVEIKNFSWLSPSTKLYLALLLDKFRGNRIEKLSIGDNFYPTSLLSDSGFGNIQTDFATKIEGNQRYLDLAAKQAEVTVSPLNAGSGTSIKRESNTGSKAMDLFEEFVFDGYDGEGNKVNKKVSINIFELEYLRIISYMQKGVYAKTMIQDILNESNQSTVEVFLNSIYFPDRLDDRIPNEAKRTYRQLLGSNLLEPIIQPVIPTIDVKTDELSDEFVAVGGHGWVSRNAIDRILETVEVQNKQSFSEFYNGEGVNDSIPPELIGYMIDEDIPVCILTVPRNENDLKGALIGEKITPSGVRVPAMMSMADAIVSNQQKLFDAIGSHNIDAIPQELRENYKPANQLFNTNIVVMNMSKLRPFLKELKYLLGEEKFNEVCSPDFLRYVNEHNGKTFIKMEGSLFSTLLNLQEFVLTDPRAKEMSLSIFGQNKKFVDFVNLNKDKRDEFFAPVKYSFNWWSLTGSDHYAISQNSWKLVNKRPGHTPIICDKLTRHPYYQVLKNIYACFGNASTIDLDRLDFDGHPVIIQNGKENDEAKRAKLSGNVSIVNNYESKNKEIFNLDTPLMREKLGIDVSGPLVLKNVSITIDKFGRIFIRPFEENLPQVIEMLRGGSFSRVFVTLNENGEKVVRKEAYMLGRQKLINEINWLNNLPSDLKDKFPKVLKSDTSGNIVYYEMPYYSDMETIANRIKNGMPAKDVKAITEKVLKFYQEKIAPNRMAQPTANYALNFLISKIYERLDQAERMSPNVFSDLIKAEEIKINGVWYDNIKTALAKIKTHPDWLNELQPPSMELFHGDLHFENILIDKDGNFIFLDPRGDDLGDQMYDIAKLLHTIVGKYDLINQDLEPTSLEGNLENGFTLQVDYPRKLKVWKVYKELEDSIPEILKNYISPENAKNDPFWFERAIFTCASLFSSDVPFKIRGDSSEEKALSIYATGVILLNKYIEIMNGDYKEYLGVKVRHTSADLVNVANSATKESVGKYDGIVDPENNVEIEQTIKRISSDLLKLGFRDMELGKILLKVLSALKNRQYFIKRNNPTKVSVIGLKDENKPLMVPSKRSLNEEFESKGELDYAVALVGGFWIETTKVICISPDGKNFIIVRRSYNPYKGTYSSVGGCVEKGETPEINALKEIQQEFGFFSAPSGELLPLGSEFTGVGQKRKAAINQLNHSFAYLCTTAEYKQIVTLMGELNYEQAWRSPEAFDQLLNDQLISNKNPTRRYDGEISRIYLMPISKFTGKPVVIDMEAINKQQPKQTYHTYTPDTFFYFWQDYKANEKLRAKINKYINLKSPVHIANELRMAVVKLLKKNIVRINALEHTKVVNKMKSGSVVNVNLTQVDNIANSTVLHDLIIAIESEFLGPRYSGAYNMLSLILGNAIENTIAKDKTLPVFVRYFKDSKKLGFDIFDTSDRKSIKQLTKELETIKNGFECTVEPVYNGDRYVGRRIKVSINLKYAKTLGMKDKASLSVNALWKHLALRDPGIPKDKTLVVFGNSMPDYPYEVLEVIQKLKPKKIIIVGNGVSPLEAGTKKPEYEQIRDKLIFLDPSLEGNIIVDENDTSMNTGENIEVLGRIIKEKGIKAQNLVVTQMFTGMRLLKKLIERQWKNVYKKNGLSRKIKFFAFSPNYNELKPGEELSATQRLYINHALGQVERFRDPQWQKNLFYSNGTELPSNISEIIASIQAGIKELKTRSTVPSNNTANIIESVNPLTVGPVWEEAAFRLLPLGVASALFSPLSFAFAGVALVSIIVFAFVHPKAITAFSDIIASWFARSKEAGVVTNNPTTKENLKTIASYLTPSVLFTTAYIVVLFAFSSIGFDLISSNIFAYLLSIDLHSKYNFMVINNQFPKRIAWLPVMNIPNDSSAAETKAKTDNIINYINKEILINNIKLTNDETAELETIVNRIVRDMSSAIPLADKEEIAVKALSELSKKYPSSEMPILALANAVKIYVSKIRHDFGSIIQGLYGPCDFTASSYGKEFPSGSVASSNAMRPIKVLTDELKSSMSWTKEVVANLTNANQVFKRAEIFEIQNFGLPISPEELLNAIHLGLKTDLGLNPTDELIEDKQDLDALDSSCKRIYTTLLSMKSVLSEISTNTNNVAENSISASQDQINKYIAELSQKPDSYWSSLGIEKNEVAAGIQVIKNKLISGELYIGGKVAVLGEPKKIKERFVVTYDITGKVFGLDRRVTQKPYRGAINDLNFAKSLVVVGEVDYNIASVFGFLAKSVRIMSVTNEQEIVLMERSKNPYKGTLTFPGMFVSGEDSLTKQFDDISQKMGLNIDSSRAVYSNTIIVKGENGSLNQLAVNYIYPISAQEKAKLAEVQAALNTARSSYVNEEEYNRNAGFYKGIYFVAIEDIVQAGHAVDSGGSVSITKKYKNGKAQTENISLTPDAVVELVNSPEFSDRLNKAIVYKRILFAAALFRDMVFNNFSEIIAKTNNIEETKPAVYELSIIIDEISKAIDASSTLGIENSKELNERSSALFKLYENLLKWDKKYTANNLYTNLMAGPIAENSLDMAKRSKFIKQAIRWFIQDVEILSNREISSIVENVEARTIIENALAIATLSGKQNGDIVINSETPMNIGTMSTAKDILGRVIGEVVRNAIESVGNKKGTILNYSPKITISASQSDGFTEFSIKDDGTAMSENSMRQLFSGTFSSQDGFVMCANMSANEKSNMRNRESKGYSFAMISNFTKALGGSVDVKSKTDFGNEIIIRVPTVYKNIATDTVVQTNERNTFLLVEDDESLAALMKRMIESSAKSKSINIVVKHISRLSEARDFIQKNANAIYAIWSDINLDKNEAAGQDMAQFESLNMFEDTTIQKSLNENSIPVVIYTGNFNQYEDRYKALEGKISLIGYLAKPLTNMMIQIKNIMDRIETLNKKRKANEAAQSLQSPLANASASLGVTINEIILPNKYEAIAIDWIEIRGMIHDIGNKLTFLSAIGWQNVESIKRDKTNPVGGLLELIASKPSEVIVDSESVQKISAYINKFKAYIKLDKFRDVPAISQKVLGSVSYGRDGSTTQGVTKKDLVTMVLVGLEDINSILVNDGIMKEENITEILANEIGRYLASNAEDISFTLNHRPIREMQIPISAEINKRNLMRIFLNLANNAKQALLEAKTKYPQVDFSINYDGENIVIVVSDNGPAIPEDIVENFNTQSALEFQGRTTKDNGNGAGLLVVKSIVELIHKGSVSIRQTKNSDDSLKEKSFVITLPRKQPIKQQISTPTETGVASIAAPFLSNLSKNTQKLINIYVSPYIETALFLTLAMFIVNPHALSLLQLSAGANSAFLTVAIALFSASHVIAKWLKDISPASRANSQYKPNYVSLKSAVNDFFKYFAPAAIFATTYIVVFSVFSFSMLMAHSLAFITAGFIHSQYNKRIIEGKLENLPLASISGSYRSETITDRLEKRDINDVLEFGNFKHIKHAIGTQMISGRSLKRWIIDHKIYASEPIEKYYGNDTYQREINHRASSIFKMRVSAIKKYIREQTVAIGKDLNELNRRLAGRNSPRLLYPLILWIANELTLVAWMNNRSVLLFNSYDITDKQFEDLPVWPVDANGNILIDLAMWMTTANGQAPDDYFRVDRMSLNELKARKIYVPQPIVPEANLPVVPNHPNQLEFIFVALGKKVALLVQQEIQRLIVIAPTGTLIAVVLKALAGNIAAQLAELFKVDQLNDSDARLAYGGMIDAISDAVQKISKVNMPVFVDRHNEVSGQTQKNSDEVIAVKVSNNPALITEDAYAFATFNRDRDKTQTLFVHKVLLDALSKLQEGERRELLSLLGQHEVLEYLALNDINSIVGTLFTGYLISIKNYSFGDATSSKNRTQEAFHSFIHYFSELKEGDFDKATNKLFIPTIRSITDRVKFLPYGVILARATVARNIAQQEKLLTFAKNINRTKSQAPALGGNKRSPAFVIDFLFPNKEGRVYTFFALVIGPIAETLAIASLFGSLGFGLTAGIFSVVHIFNKVMPRYRAEKAKSNNTLLAIANALFNSENFASDIKYLLTIFVVGSVFAAPFLILNTLSASIASFIMHFIYNFSVLKVYIKTPVAFVFNSAQPFKVVPIINRVGLAFGQIGKRVSILSLNALFGIQTIFERSLRNSDSMIRRIFNKTFRHELKVRRGIYSSEVNLTDAQILEKRNRNAEYMKSAVRVTLESLPSNSKNPVGTISSLTPFAKNMANNQVGRIVVDIPQNENGEVSAHALDWQGNFDSGVDLDAPTITSEQLKTYKKLIDQFVATASNGTDTGEYVKDALKKQFEQARVDVNKNGVQLIVELGVIKDGKLDVEKLLNWLSMADGVSLDLTGIENNSPELFDSILNGINKALKQAVLERKTANTKPVIMVKIKQHSNSQKVNDLGFESVVEVSSVDDLAGVIEMGSLVDVLNSSNKAVTEKILRASVNKGVPGVVISLGSKGEDGSVQRINANQSQTGSLFDLLQGIGQSLVPVKTPQGRYAAAVRNGSEIVYGLNDSTSLGDSLFASVNQKPSVENTLELINNALSNDIVGNLIAVDNAIKTYGGIGKIGDNLNSLSVKLMNETNPFERKILLNEMKGVLRGAAGAVLLRRTGKDFSNSSIENINTMQEYLFETCKNIIFQKGSFKGFSNGFSINSQIEALPVVLLVLTDNEKTRVVNSIISDARELAGTNPEINSNIVLLTLAESLKKGGYENIAGALRANLNFPQNLSRLSNEELIYWRNYLSISHDSFTNDQSAAIISQLNSRVMNLTDKEKCLILSLSFSLQTNNSDLKSLVGNTREQEALLGRLYGLVYMANPYVLRTVLARKFSNTTQVNSVLSSLLSNTSLKFEGLPSDYIVATGSVYFDYLVKDSKQKPEEMLGKGIDVGVTALILGAG